MLGPVFLMVTYLSGRSTQEMQNHILLFRGLNEATADASGLYHKVQSVYFGSSKEFCE